MKPFKRKKDEGYTRVLGLFENELKVYHPAFANESYRINYLIRRENHTNQADIKIIFTILDSGFLKKPFSEPNNLKDLLERFCRYFTISEVLIVRPILKNTTLVRKFKNVSSISERAYFELTIQ
jgi:hypothetical protein